MKIKLGIAGLLMTLGLTGCAQMAGTSSPNPEQPGVVISNGRIAVTLDPLYFKEGPEVKITWTLLTKGYSFPANGITVDSGTRGGAKGETKTEALSKAAVSAEFVCMPGTTPQQFVCKNARTTYGSFKYTVRVLDEKGKELLPLDPIIVNDWN